MNWKAKAPSNIALIKYMGKNCHNKNLPTNTSLSYTLNYLQSTVTLNLIDGNEDQLKVNDHIAISKHGHKRFINHLNLIKKYFDATNYHFLIQSENNFPSDCGLASSASSFAALTQAAVIALSELSGKAIPGIDERAELSRQGSGSSIRSFYKPWCLWQQDTVGAIDLQYDELIHQVIVVSQKKKAVTTSNAHKQVTNSLLFEGRPKRAEIRCKELIDALEKANWKKAFEVCWQEFWDMHCLFQTATPPFYYMLPDSVHILNYLYKYWQDMKDGPLITMDAGPNIHLLYRLEQLPMAKDIEKVFGDDYLILSSYQDVEKK